MIDRVDPVTVEVIRNSFDSIASQMNNNLARSAYTPIIYEMKDCSVGLFDARGNLLGQSPGLPIFLGALEFAIFSTTEHFGGWDIYRPGDVYAVNDSYLVGSHLNDVSVFSPIFHNDVLVGFGATKAHWLDIGAKDPGQSMNSTSIYQEGYRIGPTRLYRAGVLQTEITDFLMRNSRLPRSVWGDMHAQIAACRTGELRLQELYEKFGSDTIIQATQQIWDHCAALDRASVLLIPDGVYSAEGELDSHGPGGDPVPVKVKVTVSGEAMTLDLRGSSKQTPGSVNCGYAQTVSAAKLAFKFLVNHDVPSTGGTFRNLEIFTDKGSVFHAEEPAACQYYYPHLGLMIDLFIKALSTGLPNLAIAGQPSDAMNILFVGISPDTGEQFFTGEATGVGWGAHFEGDGGNAQINYGGGDLKNYPVEVYESRYPIRIHKYSLGANTGGRGKFRGGLGVQREYEVLAEVATVSLWFERTRTLAWGLFGGEAGIPTSVLVTTNGTTEKILKVNGLPVQKGSRVLIETGGGGGFGNVNERETQLIEVDIENGYTTSDFYK
jgi:N-methylhydantoinase B